MRLAVAAPGYAPDVGGVERHVTQLTQVLARKGVQVEVWVPSRDATETTAERIGDVVVRRFRCTASNRFATTPALWAHAHRYADKADILHVHSYHATAALAALTAPRPLPAVFTPHYHGTGHTPLANALHRPYRLLGRRLMQRCTAVIAVSDSERRLIVRDFPSIRDRVTVIHNGVDEHISRAVEPWPDQPPTLLVLGRLEPYKRVDLIMREFDRLTEDGRLVILGDGADRQRLEQVQSSLRRHRDVTLLGQVSDEHVRRWLHTARAVVSMSDQEAFGMVALEALAAGAAALVSDIPAHREVAELAGRGVTVVRDDLRQQLSAALHRPRPGPVVVRSWEQAAEEHLALYDRLSAMTGP